MVFLAFYGEGRLRPKYFGTGYQNYCTGDIKSTLIPYKKRALSDFSTNFSRSECIFIKKTGGKFWYRVPICTEVALHPLFTTKFLGDIRRS